MSAIGAVMRSEKIENARSIAISIREQRRQQQEALEGKLLAKEMGLTELRKLVDAWKGEEISLQELEAVVLMKEKECNKTRKLVAEARNTRGSTPRSPDLMQLNATPSVLHKRGSKPRSPDLMQLNATPKQSSQIKKQSEIRRVVVTPRVSETRRVAAPCA
jgi:hypothetical protein